MSRLLTLQDGAGGFEFAGNAFPIDPLPQNIVLLASFSRMLSDWVLLSKLVSLK